VYCDDDDGYCNRSHDGESHPNDQTQSEANYIDRALQPSVILTHFDVAAERFGSGMNSGRTCLNVLHAMHSTRQAMRGVGVMDALHALVGTITVFLGSLMMR
jgi:hypothetical protein